MRKEEFEKMFLKNKDYSFKKDYNKLQVVVKIDFLYNRNLNCSRESLRRTSSDYYYKYCNLVRAGMERNIEKIENKEWREIIEKAREKSKLVNKMIEMKVPFKLEYELVASDVKVNGEPHHYNSYAIFLFDIENTYIHWGSEYKRKVFVFFDEGVLTLKYPPYNLQDSCWNVGVFDKGNKLEISE